MKKTFFFALLVLLVIIFGLYSSPVNAQTTLESLKVGTFNVENLDPSDRDRFNKIAKIITNDLGNPDILALVEMQDNNGAINDNVVIATETFTTLIDAIQNKGGPNYKFTEIAPNDDQDGGEPGGNIRVGYIYNPARVNLFQAQPGGSQDAVKVISKDGQISLSLNPGRIAPTNPAFNNSRKSLATQFLFGNESVFVIANHFASKKNNNVNEPQRINQAKVIKDYVTQILNKDASSNVIVLGDLNDEPGSQTLQTLLSEGSLVDLPVSLLSPQDAYSYIFRGSKELIDHILVSPNLTAKTNPSVQIPHVNTSSSRTTRTSDHDPIIATFNFNSAKATVSNPELPQSDNLASSKELFPELTGLDLQREIRSSFQPKRTLGYGDARDKMFGELDNINGQVVDIYGGRIIRVSNDGDPSQVAGNQKVNTEHTWPQSKGAGQEPQRSDLHHLFPSDAKINNERGNKPFGEIQDTQTKKWLKGESIATTKPNSGIDDYNESISGLFEPRESIKGDVARAIFYFYTVHKSQADDSFFAQQKKDLCHWNKQDLPSSVEIKRSHAIAQLQGNENPFVIDPTLADRTYCS
jgi:endonuclease I/endonuclease/exonuclease/phosphatase family metal-dependent hydrolase